MAILLVGTVALRLRPLVAVCRFLAADGDSPGRVLAKQDICSALSDFQVVVFSL